MSNGGLQMSGFCLVAELARGGYFTNEVSPSSLQKCVHLCPSTRRQSAYLVCTLSQAVQKLKNLCLVWIFAPKIKILKIYQ